MRGLRQMALVVALACAGSAAAANDADRFGDGAVPEFYTWTEALPEPGTLLRSEPLPEKLVLDNAARAERILYASTSGLDDKTRVPVSGAVFWPKGEAPAGGWPIVAWAHGTVGTADRCAPSFAGRSQRDVQYLNAWLAAGFAVVATDYQGLGTPGGHPYLATKPEAYGVLDSVRAVRGKQQIGDAVLIVGQSQGAGAAVAAAIIAPSYAPDVKVRGTVATGLPYFSRETSEAIARTRNPDAVSASLVYNLLLLQLAEQVKPGFDATEYLSERGRSVYQLARTACFRDMANAVTGGQISFGAAFAKDPQPVLGELMRFIVYPSVQVTQPLFVGTGEADRDVPPPMQGAFVRDACAAGSRIVWRRYPGLDHSATVNASLADSMPFARAVLAGQDVTSECPKG